MMARMDRLQARIDQLGDEWFVSYAAGEGLGRRIDNARSETTDIRDQISGLVRQVGHARPAGRAGGAVTHAFGAALANASPELWRVLDAVRPHPKAIDSAAVRFHAASIRVLLLDLGALGLPAVAVVEGSDHFGLPGRVDPYAARSAAARRRRRSAEIERGGFSACQQSAE